jgi:hypothetical protein
VSVPAFGQAVTGALTGIVTDASGAVVNGANVEALNVATGLKANTKTVSGSYHIPNLPVGRYNLVVSAPHFSTVTVASVPVDLNRTNTQNVELKVGEVSTTVEVSAVSTPIDTSTAQISNTYSANFIADSGIASAGGSGIYNLSLLAPGVTSGSAMGYGFGPSVGGQRPTNNSFTVEGVDNNYKSTTGPVTFIPNDAVAEFSMLQNQFSPEFGHSSGGQFNTVVKSGTNAFHGSAYEYFQNRNLNAMDPADKNKGLTQLPRYDNNRFGGSIGGPIIKDKLFFFGLAEYNPIGSAAPAATPFCVPTAAGFSALDAMPGLSQTNLQVFETYTKPLATASTANCTTTTVNAVAIPLATVSITPPSWSNTLNTVGAIDYNISDKDQLRGRWVYNRLNQIYPGGASIPEFFSTAPSRAHTVAISEYHTFSPTLTNEFRAGYNRLWQDLPVGNQSFPGLSAFPNLVFYDLNALGIGPGGNLPQSGAQNTYQISDSISWIKGRHNFKFGGEIVHVIAPSNFVQYVRGDYEYNSLSLYLNDLSPDSYNIRGFSTGSGIFYGNNTTFAWYVNDVFKLRPNLSINLGLRYEYATLPLTASQQTLNAVNNVPGLITFGNPTVPKKQFMPRIGFAYSPGTSGNTSIRAGFGISYDIVFDNLYNNQMPQQFQYTIEQDETIQTPNFLANGGITGGAPPDDKSNTSSWIPNSVQNPYSVNWNLGVQHVIGKVWTLSADYVGTHGVHLPYQTRFNIFSPVTPTSYLPTFLSMPDATTIAGLTTNLAGLQGQGHVLPQYYNAGFTSSGGITAEIPAGWSIYHGLDIAVNRRFTNGLQVMGSYTWSHNIGNSDAMLWTTDLNPRRPQDFQNFAPEKSASLLDRRNRIVVAAVYDLPLFKNSSGLVKNVLGNWQFMPSWTLESPQYVTLQSGIDSNLNGDSWADRGIYNPQGIPGTASSAIPVTNTNGDVVGYVASVPGTSDVPCTGASTCGQYIQTGKGALANMGRNTFPLPRTDNLDFTIGKKINFTERMNVQFMAQAFNVFNHPQYISGYLNDVNNNQASNFLAQSPYRNYVLLDGTNNLFGQANQVFSGHPRTMQLVLKFNF